MTEKVQKNNRELPGFIRNHWKFLRISKKTSLKRLKTEDFISIDF
jgi:hypothetical protein